MTRRREEITWMMVVLTLLVVFIHVSSAPIGGYAKESLPFLLVFIPWRLSAFVVQGFLFLSALKLFLKKQERLKDFYLGRVTHILLPYLLWVVIYYLYFVFLRHYFPFSLAALGRHMLLGDISGQLYFIVVLLQFYLLLPFWRWMVDRVPAPLALGLSLLAVLFMPWISYRERLFPTYLFYWVLGCYMAGSYQAVLKFLKQYIWGLGLLVVAVGAMDVFFSYRSVALGQGAPFLEQLHVAYCILAILFLLGLCGRVAGQVTMPRAVAEVSGAGFAIYLSHCLVIQLVDWGLGMFGIYSISLGFVIRFVLTYGLTLPLCMWWKRIWTK